MVNIVKLNYTADEINERLGKVADVTQTTGDSETAVMSQKATTKAINSLGFERAEFSPINILEGISLTHTAGSCWGESGLTSNQYTTGYTAIQPLLDVVEGYTYKIPNFVGMVQFYDVNYANGTQLATGEIKDFEFTVPTGKCKLGVSYQHDRISAVNTVYRMTPSVDDEEETQAVKNDKLEIQPINLQSEQTKAYIKSLRVEDEINFEKDTGDFVPPNILQGISLTHTAGSCWGESGLTSNQYTTGYTAIQPLLDVVEGYTYKIPNFSGVIVLYDKNSANGTTLSQGTIADFEFTVPTGKAKLGISYLHNNISSVDTVYRLTMTAEDLQELPFKNDKFSLQTSNIINQDVKSLLCSLKDKTVVNFGDSIFGMFEAPTDISTVLAELTGATVYNCGFGGCRMASHASSYYDPFSMYRLADAVVSGDFSYQDDALSRAQSDTSQTGALVTKFPTTLARLKTIDFNKVDIVTIAYGTNDWQGKNALDNESNLTDTDYIAGALRYSIEKILNAYPHLKIFVCSPIYRCWNNTDGTLNYDSDGASSAVNGVLLTDIVSKEKEVAREYHLPFIDNYYGLSINKINRLNYFTITDGTHPNFDGRKLIAAHIAKELF